MQVSALHKLASMAHATLLSNVFVLKDGLATVARQVYNRMIVYIIYNMFM